MGTSDNGKTRSWALRANRNANLALIRTFSRAPTSLKSILRPLKRLVAKAGSVALPGWDRPLVERGVSKSLSWPPEGDASSQFRNLPKRADLRCLLVTESLDASGMDEFVSFLARRLPEHGIAASVLLVADINGWRDGRLASALRAEGIAVVSATAAEGRDVIRNSAPDILYSHGAAEWPLVVARDLGIPTLEALHGMHNVFTRTEAQLIERRSLLDGIVTVSELVRQQYLTRDRQMPADKIVTIPNGINRSRATSVDQRAARAALGLESEFLFVSLARHTIQKNTYGLADAFLEMAQKHPSAHLLVCGRPDDQDYAAQVVGLRDRSPVGAQLHLRDHAHRIDVLLAAADAFVLDSFFEGWSLASMEALGAGVPVVLSDVGGAREQLEGGVAKGLLIDNPLGDPLRVDWRTSYQARFAPQVNRAQLIATLSDFATGQVELAPRAQIREEALGRFSDDGCLLSHARLVRETVRVMTRS